MRDTTLSSVSRVASHDFALVLYWHVMATSFRSRVANQLQFPPMRFPAALFLFCTTCIGQAPAPIPDSEVPQRHEILHNRRVTVSLLELAPNDATPMHKHDRDMLSVFVSGGRTQNTLFGRKPAADKMSVGEV